MLYLIIIIVQQLIFIGVLLYLLSRIEKLIKDFILALKAKDFYEVKEIFSPEKEENPKEQYFFPEEIDAEKFLELLKNQENKQLWKPKK